MSAHPPLPKRRSRLGLAAAALFGCALVLTGCGAGIITGAIAGDRNRSQPPPVRPPSFHFSTSALPLYARGQPPLIIITLSNATFATGAKIVLSMRGGATEIRKDVVRATTNQAGFVPELPPFQQEFGVITEPAVLSTQLIVDGQPVGDSVPFLLLAPPRAVLRGRSSPTETVFVSANGQVELEAELDGIDGELSAAEFRVLTQVAGGDVREQAISGIQRVDDKVHVKWKTERSDRIGLLGISIEHARFGLSNVIESVYYEPWLSAGPPRAGSVVGGELVTLVGRGLVPLNDDGSERFDDVQLFVERGSREVRVGSRLRRDLSASNRLVFALPPSPDGRPGLAAARLSVKVADSANGPVVSTKRQQNLLVYGRRNPGFGPRGIPLTDRAVDIGFAPLGDAVGTAVDAIVLHSVGGVAQLDLLRSYGNGSFSGSGRFVGGAEPTDTLARDPRGLAIGDFNGDGLRDVVVVHYGDSQRNAAHHSILVGRKPPAGPLELAVGVVADVAGGVLAVPLRLSGSANESLVVLSDTGQPRLFVSSSDGSLQFVSRPLPVAVTDHAPYTCATRMDLNGDGVDDLLLGDAGVSPRIVAALGDGNGGFSRVLRTRFDIPGYGPRAGSNAFALHGVVRSDTVDRQVVFVLEGLVDQPGTPATIATLNFDRSTGTLRPPRADQLECFPGRRIVASALGRLDRDVVPELVLGFLDHPSETRPTVPRILEWTNGSYRSSSAPVDLGVEIMRGIAKLAIGPAVVDTGPKVRHHALFVAHETRFGGATERRLSTLLASSEPLRLLSPDASRHVTPAPSATVLGRFVLPTPETAAAEVLDVALVVGARVAFEQNDGLGRFTRVGEAPAPGILPGSAVRVLDAGRSGLGRQGTPTDAVAYLANDGRIAVVDASAPTRRVLDFDLRQLAGPGKETWPIDGSSRLFSAEVDGVGTADLVYQLVLRDPAGSALRHTVIGMLRGRTVQTTAEVPFVLPTDPLVVRLDGTGASVALGDFAPGGAGTLELAVAIPEVNQAGSGNHVRFCRFDAGGGSAPLGRAGFVWSAANPARQVLIAGDQPVQVVAADFNRDRRTDLAVVARGDHRVRLYLQGFGVDGLEVDIERFAETLQAAPAVPSGVIHSVLVQDLNLDDLPDLLVVTDVGTGQKSFAFTFFTNDGVGGLRSGRSLPPIRTGNLIFSATGAEVVRDAAVSLAVGDLNYDGAPDLVVGWDDLANPLARSLRVLFGGSR